MKISNRRKFLFSIIGSGNVAWHISSSLVQSGHNFQEIYSRNVGTANELASIFNIQVHSNLDFTKSKSQIFILAVPDNAVPDILSTIQLPPDAILMSISGSIDLKGLNLIHRRSAVLYPLQSFSKNIKIDFKDVPILVEAFEAEVLNIVKELAFSLSERVIEMGSDKREKVHLAAVFACNFTNHLLSISKSILEKEDIDFEIIRPLVMETIQKAFLLGPKEGQTGPAMRGDTKTLNRHLHLLKTEEDLKNIYKQLSIQIKKATNNS